MLLLYNDIYVEALGIEVPNKAVMEDSFDKAGRVVSQAFLFSFFFNLSCIPVESVFYDLFYGGGFHPSSPSPLP